MEETRKILGKRIRDAREEKGITQKQLGDLLNCSPMAISHFENGIRELKLSTLQKLSSFLGKPLQFFLQMPTATLFRAEPGNDPEVTEALDRFEQHLNTLHNE